VVGINVVNTNGQSDSFDFTVSANLGFDVSAYPGDTTMKNFIGNGAPFSFAGFYLAPAPCHFDTSWMTKRPFLAGLGYGFLPIYVGQQLSGSGCKSNNLTAAQVETV